MYNMSDSICLSDAALKKVWQLMRSEDDFSLKLRAYVMGGGCQGFQYGFAFEFEKGPDDFELVLQVPQALQSCMTTFLHALVHANGAGSSIEGGGREGCVSVVVDPISLLYLKGAQVDYVSDGHGERFVVHNPNAKTTCGCARSFTPTAA